MVPVQAVQAEVLDLDVVPVDLLGESYLTGN
jgi:hypothetical protein